MHKHAPTLLRELKLNDFILHSLPRMNEERRQNVNRSMTLQLVMRTKQLNNWIEPESIYRFERVLWACEKMVAEIWCHNSNVNCPLQSGPD